MHKVLASAAFVLLATASRAADVAPATPIVPPLCGEEQSGSDRPAHEILTGYGTGGFPVRAASPQAQAFFDNGMQLGHAFAHAASAAAFKAAQRADPTCAMCVWGEAWSRGPTINYPIDAAAQKELAGLVAKAEVLAADGPLKERQLIAALKKRYTDGGGAGPGDYAFARAMDDLARAYPDDSEIAIVAADAWMIPAAQKNNTRNLGRSIELIKGVLARRPDDTGAIHFFIHATEMDGHGVDALPYAERLQALAPSASHLTHMPSHTYFWAGHYRRAEQSNLDAVKLDEANAVRLHTKGGAFGLTYHFHNVQFGIGSALMDGDAAGALALSKGALEQVPKLKPNDVFRQVEIGTAYFALGRYGGQADVAALHDPGDQTPYLRALWRYARGEAAARRADAQAVRAEAAAIRLDPTQAKAFGEYAPQGAAMVKVARLVLEGRASMLEGHFDQAADSYRKAADIQESALALLSDPPGWWFPVRRSLAAALLAGGKPAAAADEARASLRRWPWDPLTLAVLVRSEQAQGRTPTAQAQWQAARGNWMGDLNVEDPMI